MPELNWNSIEKLRDIFIRKYTNSELGSELEKACSEEYELTRDYNGRQILELLQNVDDACAEKQNIKTDEVVVKISFKNDILEVGNTGTAFSAETIERLCIGRASNKSYENIGNKGTGFRSLLNDAEYVELYSGDFSIRFSSSYAQEIFKKYTNDRKIKNQIDNWKKDYPLCFPIMNCPESIDKVYSGFDTLIRVKVKTDNKNKETGIENQLRQPFYKSLLFLPNITKIIIETDNVRKEYVKISDNHNVVIEEYENGEYKTSEKYFLYSKNVLINKKNAKLIIAVPKSDDYDFSREKLYCYFPIRNFSTPVHALIHAPFITNNSRDDVPNDNEQINKKIFNEILIFIKDVADKLAKENDSDLSIKMVTPFENKLWDSDVFNLNDSYFTLISKARILPTVNNEYVSIADNPKLFESNFPEEFLGNQFKSLLVPLTDSCINFIYKLASFIKYSELKYSPSELSEKINILAKTWNIKTQIKIFLWWSKNYKNSKAIPNLLKDTKDRWIEYSSKVYLPTESGISILPDELSWVKLCILRQDYVDELIFQMKEDFQNEWNLYYTEHDKPGDKRILAELSNNFIIKFTEQSSLSLMISSINQQIENLSQAKSFINWFFQNYKDKEFGNEISDISYRLPNKKYEIKSIKDLYLGENYGNSLAEKLFASTSKESLISIEEIYEGSEKDEFILFLKKCGILEFPKIEIKKESYAWSFKSYVHNNYVKNRTVNYITSFKIENFEKLISVLSTEEIKEWFSKDNVLKNFLLSEECNSKAYQQSNWSPDYFPSNAYLKYILNNTPWIEFDGKKYPPCKIIKNAKIKNKINGFYGISENELRQYLGDDIAIKLNLDFKESIAELSDSEIKQILDALPDFDNGEISRSLYSDIIKFKKDETPIYSINNLKLLARDGRFYRNAELKYADKRTAIAEKNKSQFIWIQPKQSIETIRNWLGVERYKSDLKLESYNHIEIENFTSEINDIKVAVLCTIEECSKQNVASIKKLEIIPCSEIKAFDKAQNNELKTLTDFFFLNDVNKFYLKIPENSNVIDIRQSGEFSSAITEIFRQILNIELKSDLIELLISKNHIDKKQKIDEKYNCDRWNDSYEKLFNRSEVNELIYKFFKVNALSETLYERLSLINFADVLSYNDTEILIEALTNISKDISDLNLLSDLINIDIRPFLRNKLKKFFDSNYEDYRNRLYNSIEIKDIEEKKSFLLRLEKYRNFDISKIELNNSINIDLASEVLNVFPIMKNKVNVQIDIDDIYNNNVKSILEKTGISQDEFDDFIRGHSDFNSILYFEIPAKIYPMLKEYSNQNECNIDETKQDESESSTKTITTFLEKVNFQKNEVFKNIGSEQSRKYYERRNSLNQRNGKNAELIAYNELKKSYSELIWHSQFTTKAADRNKLPPNGIICDMWNFDSKNGNLYFEVKSAETEFEMTKNEYDSMKRNKNNYFVVLVNLKTYEISCHKFEEIDSLKEINEYRFVFRQTKI